MDSHDHLPCGPAAGLELLECHIYFVLILCVYLYSDSLSRGFTVHLDKNACNEIKKNEIRKKIVIEESQFLEN
jgi:hypothetical protein